MATVQEPEVQFAQKLASNEKPIRTKAIKKLKKYINVRSQRATGGFTGDELLKLWKGLFYCLWMQDKPLLQEELSNQISTLIHSFQDIDGQLLYLESFLQTFKREWTGIDRLRMDKFFQLVRFMFRQTFEMLKRKNWESSARFLELLTAQLLQSDSAAPSGLQFHILDLYMTELAAVGSAELTANQNLVFIEPFCKTAAKTKDRSLFRAICNSIFSTVIDQAPFAIEELIKEVNADEDLDSGQASEEDDEDQIKEKTSKLPSKKWAGKRINGNKSNEEEEEDEDELLHSEEDDTELPCDGDIGPVLQFDYAALADKLFVLASRSSTPSHNRQRLYKIIKVLRDLGEGIFPQDEYPEEVSTDEDDEMFGSRKRMKRGGFPVDEDEEGTPAVKKKKGKKGEATTLNKQNKDMVKDDSEEVDQTRNERKKKKKKKKKKKAKQVKSACSEESVEKFTQGQTLTQAQSPIKEPEGSPQCSQAEDLEKEAEFTVKVTEATTAQSQSETLFLSEVKKQPSVTVTEEDGQPKPCTADNKDQSEAFTKKKKKRDTSKPKPGVVTGEEQQTSPTTESEMSPEADSPVSGKKNKRLKAEVQSDGMKTQSQVSAEATLESCEASEETTMTTPKTDATIPAKKSRKVMKAASKPEGSEGDTQVYSVSAEDDGTSVNCEDSAEGDTITKPKKPTGAIIPAKKNKKKEGLKVDAHVEIEGEHTNTEITSEALQYTTAGPVKKKTKKMGTQKLEQSLVASPVADDNIETPLKNKSKRNRKQTKISVKEEQVAVETLQDTELPMDEIGVVSSYSKLTKKKKRKIPVVVEFEADELETTAQEAASINGLGEKETVAKKTKLGNDVEEPSTPLSVKKSQKKGKAASLASDFITFQSNTMAPTPLFCKTKGSPSTPFSSKKKCQTPKSESKKVTFGLKNNKTAEFRKTDRSLLVSPDGSSRVPFDPKQKPKFGVLKSPPTPGSTPIKATTNAKRKTSLNSQKNTPKRRPSAADFF